MFDAQANAQNIGSAAADNNPEIKKVPWRSADARVSRRQGAGETHLKIAAPEHGPTWMRTLYNIRAPNHDDGAPERLQRRSRRVTMNRGDK
jgi:hypothetical protein